MIRNIAIKGGGIKGIAYVGALQVLEENQQLAHVERVSGTSAGALVAGMMSVGFSADEIKELMLSLDFKKFEGGWNPIRIFTKYGLYTGDYILDFIYKFLAKSKYKFSKNATFKDLRDAGCKDLYVFSCNVNAQKAVELSADATPGAFVAEAIRASMSIPFFFKAFQFSNGIPNKHVYVDGGMVYNYPLSFFDQERFCQEEINYESMGLYLYAKSVKTPRDLENNTPMYFAKQLLESMMDAQDIMFSEDKVLLDRSIMIDDLNYSSTDFKLSRDDMNKLMASGAESAKKYLASHK